MGRTTHSRPLSCACCSRSRVLRSASRRPSTYPARATGTRCAFPWKKKTRISPQVSSFQSKIWIRSIAPTHSELQSGFPHKTLDGVLATPVDTHSQTPNENSPTPRAGAARRRRTARRPPARDPTRRRRAVRASARQRRAASARASPWAPAPAESPLPVHNESLTKSATHQRVCNFI